MNPNTPNKEMIETIITTWGLQDLPKEKQEEMVGRIGDLIYQGVLLKAVNMLSEADQNEFDTLVEQPDTDADHVMKFFSSKIQNFDEIVASEARRIKEQTVDLV